jgi:uncharacterized OsmC-like protein
MRTSIVHQRQQPLIQEYLVHPEKAWIKDFAVVESNDYENPLQTKVILNDEVKNEYPVGLHRAIGGLHQIANPGDILCGALASCFETTLRMIANRLQIKLLKTKVVARAYADVRGTLQMDKTVPVEFQKMELEIIVEAEDNTNPTLLTTLIKATEYSCVVFQTLKKGTPIDSNVRILNLLEEEIA